MATLDRRAAVIAAIMGVLLVTPLALLVPITDVLERSSDAPSASTAEDPGFTGRLPDGESSRIFARSSFWYRPLPNNTPLDPNSEAIVKRISQVARESFRDDPYEHPPTLPEDPPAVILNTHAYSPGVFVARRTDPVATFTWDNCGNLEAAVGEDLVRNLTGVRVPLGTEPAQGNDAEMVVYNRDTRQLTELWRVTKLGPTHFSVCWGGTIADARASIGAFSGHYGATATGLSFVGGMITASELEAGRIDHALGVVLDVSIVNSRVSWPAQRTDGVAVGKDTIAAGQMLRLPASLDISSLNLSRASRTIAHAAQRYGLMVWDRGAPFSLRAVNPNSLGGDPYPALVGDEGYGLMGNTERGEDPFPIDRLQVLPLNYRAP